MGLRPVQVTTSSTQEDKQALMHTFTPSFIVETIYKTYMFELEKQTSHGENIFCVMQQCYPLGGGPPSCSGLLFRHKLTWKAPIYWHCKVIKMNM